MIPVENGNELALACRLPNKGVTDVVLFFTEEVILYTGVGMLEKGVGRF